MSATEANEPGLEILRKADLILRALVRSPGMSVAEMSAQTGEPASSLYRLFATLTALGIVDATDRRGRYRLGLAAMSLGEAVERRLDIRPLARPELTRVRDETGLTALLCVLRGHRVACIERVEGRGARSLVMLIGASLPLYAGAAPMAILAALPQPERRRLAAATSPSEPHDPVKPPLERILAEAERSRRRGHSVSDGDVTDGVAALAAPVLNHRGEVVAAVSVSGLRAAVLGDAEANVAAVQSCARAVSARLGADLEARA